MEEKDKKRRKRIITIITIIIIIIILLLLRTCSKRNTEKVVDDGSTQEVVEPSNQDTSSTDTVSSEEVKEEKQEQTDTTVEEAKKKEDVKDITKMSFWVVFYDQYDNELQREALKYGTVPEYKSWLPEGFDKWVYKRSGKDVGSFKAITGNTYFKAVCHEVSHSGGSSSGGGGSNPPTPPSPSAGSVITFNDGKDYRILKKEGNKALVLYMGNDISKSNYWDTANYISFGAGSGNKYEGSGVDTAMTNWYNSLADGDPNGSQPLHDAILPTNDLKQNMYEMIMGTASGSYVAKGVDNTGDPYYLTGGYTPVSIPERYVFTLDLQMIIDYVGNEFTPEKLSTMFGDPSNPLPTGSIWLSSASAHGIYESLNISVSSLAITYGDMRFGAFVRPVFYVDLSYPGLTIN